MEYGRYHVDRVALSGSFIYFLGYIQYSSRVISDLAPNVMIKRF